MISYMASFFQSDQEYKAACKSREIYDQIFMRFLSRPPNIKCSAPKCSGWRRVYVFDSPWGGFCDHWEACTHRKRRGLEARKEDMLPRDIKKAEDRLFDWNAYWDKQKLEQKKKEAEKLDQQVMKQVDVLEQRKKL